MKKTKLVISLIKSEYLNFEDIVGYEAHILQKFSNDKIAYYANSITTNPVWVEGFFNIRSEKNLSIQCKSIMSY